MMGLTKHIDDRTFSTTLLRNFFSANYLTISFAIAFFALTVIYEKNYISYFYSLVLWICV